MMYPVQFKELQSGIRVKKVTHLLWASVATFNPRDEFNG